MKKLFTLFSLTFSVVLFGQIPSVGLIGGWPFTGNANDMSGMGNNGTVFGAVLTTDRFGAANSAYTFNGTTNYIDMLTAGPTGTVSRSVSFWERTTYTANVTCGFTYGLPGSGGSFQVNFNYSCKAVGIDNSSSAVMRGSGVIDDGQWHHIVAIMNSTVGIMTGNVQVYIDGTLQPTIACVVSGTNSPINTNATMPIRIGYDNTVRYFKGDLDDFYMYNRAITPTEVLQLFNYSPTGIDQLSMNRSETLIYPNPFSNSVFITSLNSPSVIEVYNTLGALVYNGSFEKEKIQIDLSNKDKGIYFVRIKNSSGIITRKIVKE